MPDSRPDVVAGRRRGFLSRHEEGDVTPVLRGALPDWLKGHYLLNGPALWDLPKGSYKHWFDGLAQLHSFTLGGGVAYRSRYLRSESFRKAMAAGRPALGEYGTRASKGLLGRLASIGHPERSDNAAVVMSRLGGRWLATTESDRALFFDPVTLETQGELPWTDSETMPLMAAHPCVDAAGHWWNVGVALGKTCEYRLFRAEPGGRREVRARIAVERAGYLHAFALTHSHALVWENALRAQPLRFLFSAESYIEHFDWLPGKGSRIHAVALADGSVRSWDAPAMLTFHAAQAFAQGGDLVLDLCVAGPGINDALRLETLRHGRFDPELHSQHRRYVLARGMASAKLEDLPGRFDLPQTHPGAAARGAVRHVFGAATDPATPGEFFNQVVKVDLQSGNVQRWGRADALSFEPLFVPRPGGTEDDDGLLLVHTLADGDAGSVIVALDAATLSEQARIEMPHVIPSGFHGAWAPAASTA